MARTPRIVIYKDKSGQFRWSLRAKNGKVVADSSESYVRTAKAEDAAIKMLGWITAAEIVPYQAKK